MTASEVHAELETIMGLPPGSVVGNEELKSFKGWDSLAIVEFISLVDSRLGITLESERLDDCRTIQDLLTLINVQPT